MLPQHEEAAGPSAKATSTTAAAAQESDTKCCGEGGAKRYMPETLIFLRGPGFVYPSPAYTPTPTQSQRGQKPHGIAFELIYRANIGANQGPPVAGLAGKRPKIDDIRPYHHPPLNI